MKKTTELNASSAAKTDGARSVPQGQNIVFQAVSYLLQYPTETWTADLDYLQNNLSACPETAGKLLAEFLQWAKNSGQTEVEKTYVETFDQRRRCCLELSYYTTGDTRQRGIALSIFQDLYAAVGWELTGENLPDYLPYLLELAAATQGKDQELVLGMLASHQDGIEVLAQALHSLSSPWAEVIGALQSVLPAPDPETQTKMLQLIRTGPPSETVGTNTQGQDSGTVLLSSAAALAATMTRKTKKMEKKQ